MRVLEPRGDLDFAEEALVPERRCELGVENLDRDGPMVLQVVGQVDGGHPAAPERALEAVGTRQRTGDSFERRRRFGH